MAGNSKGNIMFRAALAGLTVEDYLRRESNGEKFCTKCRTWRSRSDFHTDRSRHDGLCNYCAYCRSTNLGRFHSGPIQHERRKKAEQGLAWCSGCSAYQPEDEVRDGICREHQNAYARRLYAENEAFRARRRFRVHARRRGVDPIETDHADALLLFFAGRCAYCGAPATTWDHIIPISKGGMSVPGNLLPACIGCNSSKKDASLNAWARRTNVDLSPQVLAVLTRPQLFCIDSGVRAGQ